jgi:site-specific DNA recombinase
MQQKFAQRNNKHHFYLLRSLLVCGLCGRTLVGRTIGSHVTYSCSSRGKNRSPEVAPHNCTIAAEVVEPLVWEAVTHLVRNPRLLADAWESQAQAVAPSPGELDRLQARLKTLDRQWQRLIDLFQEEQIDKVEFAHRKERVDQERHVIAQRLEQLRRQEHQEQVKEQLLQDFAAFCQQIEANLADPTPELRQEVIRLLIDHVVVRKDEIVIRHIVPTDDDSRLLPRRR